LTIRVFRGWTPIRQGLTLEGMTFRCARFAIVLLVACRGWAQDVARMEQVIQAYTANQRFMGAVLVAKGTEVVLNKGYGSANLEWDVPNSPTTKFRLGSITKQFTAASILLLQERGKLNVQDPVKKYMADAPAAWDKITIYNVLTHTSGIPSFTSFPEYAKWEPFATTAAEEVAWFRDKPLDFAPGEKWSYSNSGYVLLGYLIEKITGASYEKFVRENIFTPLGMKDSGYDSNSTVIVHRAAGYTAGKNGLENAGFVNMTIPFSAGALYSTTEDLLRWEQGLFGGKLLSAASLKTMTTPFLNDYACGLGVQTKNGRTVIEHGGGIEGFNTQLTYYPDDKLTVVVLGNVSGAAPGEIAAKLAAVAHGEAVKLPTERKEVTVDPKVLARYVGTYELMDGADMLITLDGDQLSEKLGEQPTFPIFPESETMFFLKVVDAQIEFVKDASGAVTALVLHQGGRDQKAPRISDKAVQARSQLNKGVQAFKSALYPAAVAHFTTAVELDPNFITARLYLATAYMQQYIPGADSPDNQQMAKAAYDQFQEVLTRDPKNELAVASIASLLFNEKKLDEANEWNLKLIALNPKAKDAYYTLGVIAWTKALVADGEARAKLGMKPEDPGPLKDKKVRAEVAAKNGPIVDEGFKDLDKALQIDPEYDDAMAYENLLYRQKADLEDSPEAYRADIEAADNFFARTLETRKVKAERNAHSTTQEPR
jgi:CubicO group peptidase (beta-lactamase class C family)/Tfp pilus assembly protein PilF